MFGLADHVLGLVSPVFGLLGKSLLVLGGQSEYPTKIINDAKADLSPFLDIPDDHEILFYKAVDLGGFRLWLINLLAPGLPANTRELGSDDGSIQELKSAVQDLRMDYIITGGWLQKAATEAEPLFGPEHVHIAADNRKKNNGKFGTIPDETTWDLSRDSAVVYLCDNETVDGVEFPRFPKCLEPRPDGPINYSAIFFGAQKNLGLAGITVVVIKKSFLPQPSAVLMKQLALPFPPRILETITKKQQPVQHTKHLCEAVSKQKAQLVYKTLEEYPDVHHVVPDKTVRSRMNICFRITGGDDAEEEFLKRGTDLGLIGLRGRRDLRGVRISDHNSVAFEDMAKLASFIGTFASQWGK
ncbi:Phosphoserine aminotransferase [Paramyrothecium foliicola]|nr:Phosphoserine aminotransferase [Paramyrothecium foliicola]